MEESLTMSEKIDIKKSRKRVRELLKRKDLDELNLLTLQNSLKTAGLSVASKELASLLSKVELELNKRSEK